jgi:hypothetical protein
MMIKSGRFEGQACTLEQAVVAAGDATSAVSHEVTASVLAGLLGRAVAFARVNLALMPGDEIVMVCPKFRAEVAREFTRAEVECAGVTCAIINILPPPLCDGGEELDFSGATTASESEHDALINAFTEEGMETISVRAGNSPYSAETRVIFLPPFPERGTFVALKGLARSYNGAGNYKGRGRWATSILVTPSSDGAWAMCEPGDRGAREIGLLSIRPRVEQETETASGGLGPLAAAFAAAKKLK